MTKGKSLKIALVTAVLALTAAASSHAAWTYNHENRLSFSQPVALPGVVLPAGEYSFDVASPTGLDVVVVRDRKTSKVFYMGFTRTVNRPRTSVRKEDEVTWVVTALDRKHPDRIGHLRVNDPSDS